MAEQTPTASNVEILGWPAIAAAVSKAINASVCEKTARRYAQHGRENRLPVMKYMNNCRVYITTENLALWVAARLAQVTQ